MDDVLNVLALERIGLVANLIGTMLVAFSFGANPGEAYQDVDGRRIYLASFRRPNWFKCGLASLGIGFVLQLIGTF